MAVINWNDSTPAAPAGKINIKWQADTSSPRNVSAYVDLNSGHVCEAPVGAINGSNAVFTLSFTPAAGSLLLALNGVVQNPGAGSPPAGADYTISGTTISYAVAPRAGDIHRAWYAH